MDEATANYIKGFDELNILVATSYGEASTESLTVRIDQIIDDFLSFLICAYILGIQNASIMLDYEIEIKISKMHEAIYKVIDGKTFEARVADHVIDDDLFALILLAESEYHRVYNTALYDGACEYADNNNSNVVKTWYTLADEYVRTTHFYLDGVSVPFEDEFFTIDGDHALYPGGFQSAKNNVNCRCHIELSTGNV